jgi:hypoxanthine phosphoribosyltransferase
MQEKFSCILVDWNYAYDLCKDVRDEIKEAGFKPEVIVGVARGGWYLARVLCDFFLLKDLLSLKMEHWGVTATITGTAELKYGLDDAARAKLKDKRVLIADDITDTGESIKLVVDYIKSMGAKEVKTATLQHKTSSSFIPDFYGELMKEWKWVVYIWSIHEDMMDLIGRVIANGELSIEEIRAAMNDEFDFYVPYHLLNEVLENMKYHGKIKSKEERGTVVWGKKEEKK